MTQTLSIVNFTVKSSYVDGVGSLKHPTEEVKLTETSLGRLRLLASNTLLLVTFSIYTHIFDYPLNYYDDISLNYCDDMVII